MSDTSEAAALRQGLWDVWVALGHDTDGDTGPGAFIAGMGIDGFIAMVIRDATTWRRESEDDYANDTDRLEARAKAAEATVARVEALLEAWDEIPDYMPSHYDRGRVDQRHMAAEELATALAGPDA